MHVAEDSGRLTQELDSFSSQEVGSPNGSAAHLIRLYYMDYSPSPKRCIVLGWVAIREAGFCTENLGLYEKGGILSHTNIVAPPRPRLA